MGVEKSRGKVSFVIANSGGERKGPAARAEVGPHREAQVTIRSRSRTTSSCCLNGIFCGLHINTGQRFEGEVEKYADIERSSGHRDSSLLVLHVLRISWVDEGRQ